MKGEGEGSIRWRRMKGERSVWEGWGKIEAEMKVRRIRLAITSTDTSVDLREGSEDEEADEDFSS